jgi:DNA-binding response OmpR family regulator
VNHILLIEDDLALSNGIVMALQNEQTELIQCHTLQQARSCVASQCIQLAILDINLPDGSGLDLLREIRKTQTTPIIILTANDMETDIVAGLELGADDYITKPFSLAVLRARVNTQLRKMAGASSEKVMLDDFAFNFEKMEFSKGSTLIELSKTEQKLLRILVSNRGRTITRPDLVDRIWTDGAEYVDENALSVTIKRLRDKLEDNPAKPQYIKTIYGIGYTWAVK